MYIHTFYLAHYLQGMKLIKELLKLRIYLQLFLENKGLERLFFLIFSFLEFISKKRLI